LSFANTDLEKEDGVLGNDDDVAWLCEEVFLCGGGTIAEFDADDVFNTIVEEIIAGGIDDDGKSEPERVPEELIELIEDDAGARTGRDTLDLEL
jgi:hypothetical protein